MDLKGFKVSQLEKIHKETERKWTKESQLDPSTESQFPLFQRQQRRRVVDVFVQGSLPVKPDFPHSRLHLNVMTKNQLKMNKFCPRFES